MYQQINLFKFNKKYKNNISSFSSHNIGHVKTHFLSRWKTFFQSTSSPSSVPFRTKSICCCEKWKVTSSRHIRCSVQTEAITLHADDAAWVTIRRFAVEDVSRTKISSNHIQPLTRSGIDYLYAAYLHLNPCGPVSLVEFL